MALFAFQYFQIFAHFFFKGVFSTKPPRFFSVINLENKLRHRVKNYYLLKKNFFWKKHQGIFLKKYYFMRGLYPFKSGMNYYRVSLKRKFRKAGFYPLFNKYFLWVNSLRKFQKNILEKPTVWKFLNTYASVDRLFSKSFRFFLQKPLHQNLGLYVTKSRTRFYILSRRVFSFNFMTKTK
jgi:hypothetical protein